MIWLLLSCDEKEEQVQAEELIDITMWSQVELEADILKEHQPEEIECDISAFSLEIDQLEIQTDLCNYAAIEFETQKDILAGTTIEALVLHTGLWALEEAEAHFAFYINDDLLWEEYSPIPADTEFFFMEKMIQTDIPMGATIYFHLHNHGANDWKLGYIRESE